MLKKRLSLRNIAAIVACLIVTTMVSGCDKKNVSEEDESLVFSVQYSGGWTMIDENLKINANTTCFFSSYHDRSTMKRISYQTTIKTLTELWNNLTKTFKLETLKKIKDGSCRACVDGVDETFSVTINGETYSFYNGVIDEHYQQMQSLFDSIYEQIETFRDNAKYQ